MSFRDKVPHTFAKIIIGDEETHDFITFSNKMDKKVKNITNLHLTNLSVEQKNADLIKYTFSVQYHPSTFSKADVLKLERMITSIMSKEGVDKNNIIKIQFGYISGSPYKHFVRNQSNFYVGTILELKTNVQQNYIEYSFTACGTNKIAENLCLNSNLKLSTKEPITKWIKEKLMPAVSKGSSDNSSKLKGEHSAAYKPLFDFKSDVDLPSIEDLTGMFNVFLKAGLSNEEAAQLMREIHFEDILDFSQYNSDASYNSKQGSLTFPADFDFMTLLKALCDKITDICGMEGIKYTSWKQYANHKFKIVYDSTTIGNGDLMGTIYFTDITSTENRRAFNYVFNYGFIEKSDDFIDHTVLSWECDYNATYVIHSTDKKTTEELNIAQAISPNGTIIAMPFAKTALNAGKMETSLEIGIDTYLSQQNKKDILQSYAYPYEATLTVLGNPEPIQVCRKIIQVIPKLNNSIHHTAGKYLVTGVSHNIDSSMTFTTTYNLIRLDEEHAEKFENNGYSDAEAIIEEAKSIQRSVNSNKRELEKSYAII